MPGYLVMPKKRFWFHTSRAIESMVDQSSRKRSSDGFANPWRAAVLSPRFLLVIGVVIVLDLLAFCCLNPRPL